MAIEAFGPLEGGVIVISPFDVLAMLSFLYLAQRFVRYMFRAAATAKPHAA